MLFCEADVVSCFNNAISVGDCTVFGYNLTYLIRPVLWWGIIPCL